MDWKAVRYQILHGSIARRVLYRTFVIASAVSIIPLLQILSGSDSGIFASVATSNCALNSGFSTVAMVPATYMFRARFLNPIWGSFQSVQCKETATMTVNVVRELVDKKFLNVNAKALFIGEGWAFAVMALRDLGFSNVDGASNKHRFLSLNRKLVHELDYMDNSFDFVLSRDNDQVSTPALLVLEMERILVTGGIGAMLVGVSSTVPNGLIRSATPVSSLLKSSDVVHVGYVHNFTLVVFKKRFEDAGFFKQYRLPADCPSVTNNKPFMDQIEPLVEEKSVGFENWFSYLPKLMDVDAKKRMVYIDIGAGVHLNSNVMNWFLPSYPVDSKAFNVYFVDHNTSVLLSYVKKPGITFVYHPGLAGNGAPANHTSNEDIDPPMQIEGFNFLSWFKETVQYADFVVLKMNSGKVERKFLSELFESGAICFVDEMFLHCSEGAVGGGRAIKGECMDLFKGLRSRGVFVHQWWGD